MFYVRLTSSSGNWDAEFLLLEVLRTHADEPWTAAFDPKRNISSEPVPGDQRVQQLLDIDAIGPDVPSLAVDLQAGRVCPRLS